MKKIEIKYGLASGIISIIFGLLNWFLLAPNFEVGVSQVVGYLTIAASLLAIPLGIKHYRDNENEGKISFKESFKIGFGVSLIASVIMSLYGALFFVFEGETFKEWQANNAANDLGQLPEQAASMPEFVFTPWFQGIVMFITVLMIGLIINLISSFVMKQNNLEH